MKKYNRQSVLNFVSSKNSTNNMNGKEDSSKESTLKKPTVVGSLVISGFLTVPNFVQWGDPIVRILFIIQLMCIVLWLLMSKYWLKLIISEEVPANSKYQLLSSLAFFIIVELMFIGGFRAVDSDLKLIIPIGMFILQICFSFIYETIRVIRAIDGNNGILNKPFENMKRPNESIGYLIVTVITMFALRGHLAMLTVAMVFVGTFITIILSRAITMHIYIVYFAKKYGFESSIFNNE